MSIRNRLDRFFTNLAPIERHAITLSSDPAAYGGVTFTDTDHAALAALLADVQDPDFFPAYEALQDLRDECVTEVANTAARLVYLSIDQAPEDERDAEWELLITLVADWNVLQGQLAHWEQS